VNGFVSVFAEEASAINNAFSRRAGLLAVAVLGVIIFMSFSSSLDDRLAALNLPPEAAVAGRKGEAGGRASTGGSRCRAARERRSSDRRGIRRRLPDGYARGGGNFAGASALSAALLLEGKKSKGSAQQTIAEEEVVPDPLEP
jgi:hypothetical protein